MSVEYAQPATYSSQPNVGPMLEAVPQRDAEVILFPLTKYATSAIAAEIDLEAPARRTPDAVDDFFAEVAATDGEFSPDTPEQLADRATWMPAMERLQSHPDLTHRAAR